MIISRSPLRITLGGGGTDLPSYYQVHEGFVLSAAIDKYVYVSVMRPFINGIILKYSEIEHVETVEEINHKIIREVLLLEKLKTPQLEISTLADIPAGTGLGSSGSFTTALIKAVYSHRKRLISPVELAELACYVEIDKLRKPVGKQDQYIAAHGGITEFTFQADGSVISNPLALSIETLFCLEENLLLFFTGFTRSAGDILQDQKDKTLNSDVKMLENLHFTKKLGIESKKALLAGDLNKFGELMNVHWQHKKERMSGMSNTNIDKWYSDAMRNGAVGGKLVGAGGGGFLMFYAEDKKALRAVMKKNGLDEVRFKFDFEGTRNVYS